MVRPKYLIGADEGVVWQQETGFVLEQEYAPVVRVVVQKSVQVFVDRRVSRDAMKKMIDDLQNGWGISYTNRFKKADALLLDSGREVQESGL